MAALCNSLEQNLSCYTFVKSLITGIVLCHFAGTKSITTEGANRVDVCPRNRTEWQEASRRLNCLDDIRNPVNRYHCLPVHNLSTLLEFCYNQTRPRVVSGRCMVYVQEINYLNGYNCETFDEGCPNASYFSDETYLFPYCTAIDPVRHCYVAESSCQLTTIFSTDISSIKTVLFNETSALSTTEASEREENSAALNIVLPTIAVFLVIVVILVCVLLKQRSGNLHFPRDNMKGENNCLLDETIDTEICRLKLDYLLGELSNVSSKFSQIATKLNIPPEILSWSKDNRRRFVDSMKAGQISVYTGRVMVIGCAEAGKTTLVKKLKGEKDLSTESTSGIEIHSHVFKLHANESTIIACKEQDKDKGCLCLTPTTLVQQGKTSPGMSADTQTVSLSDIELKKQQKTAEPKTSIHVTLLSDNKVDIRDEGRKDIVNEEAVFPSDRLSDYSRASIEVGSDDAIKIDRKSEEEVDFKSCLATVNEDSLKMISLLDFAGQSAYYACHHIFFSQRAFYILVVDMSKDLDDLATQACNDKDLIYSSWTYADYVRYWLGSIHTYSSKTAPVILVASHSENVKEDPKREAILSYYLKICGCLTPKLLDHIDKERMFFVEKDSNKNIEKLKECIASTLKKQNHWGENVPIAWTKLESFLKKKKEVTRACLFSNLLDDVQKEDNQLWNSRHDLITALKFFHDTGVILFRKEIENVIILDVQWFVDAFKNIIMDERHNKEKNEYNFKQFEALNSCGLLSSKLLDAVWRKSDFFQHKKSLLYHMKHLDMLAELSPEFWYVPCMNKQKYTDSVLDNCTVSSTLCFVFEFLPFVIFHRLIVACINKLRMTLWQNRGKYCIYHTATILSCENTNHRMLIGIHDGQGHEEYPFSIEIQAIVTKPRTLDSQLCSEIKQKIEKILFDLTRAFPSNEESFQTGYRCTRKPYSNQPEGNIMLEKDMSSETDCSKCAPVHAVDVKSIVGFWKSQPKGLSKNTAWRLLRSLHECSSISISNVYNVNHISHVTATFVWLSNRKSVFKIDHSGRVLHKFRIDDIWGSASHTIDQSGNCLLIRNDKILRCKSNEEEETLIAPDWTVLSIYSSKLNGDILLGIYILIEKGSRTKLARYTRDGGVISELEYFEEKRLYVSPLYLSENINSDICTADIDTCLVKAVDKNGKLKFSYSGLPSHADFFPTGICNDSLGHVIVCNRHDSNPSVHLLDVSGEFLSLILHDRDDIHDPWGLCVDEDGRLYLGQNDCSSIKVFKYLEKDN